MARSERIPRTVISRPVVGGVLALVLLLAGLSLWSANAAIQTAVIAAGALGSADDRHPVQHPTGGIVVEIGEKEGDLVEAGQLLLRLDASELQATLAIFDNQIAQLLALQGRLIAERDELAEPFYLEEARDNAELRMRSEQAEILRTRIEITARETALTGERIAIFEARIDALGDEATALVELGTSIAHDIENITALLEKGLAQTSTLRAFEREAQAIAIQRGQNREAIAAIQADINALQAALVRARSDRFEAAIAGLTQIAPQLVELEEKRREVERQANRMTILAPTSGRVHQLLVNEIGELAAAGEVLLFIVPETPSRTVTLRIRPIDIDAVTEGMTAGLRFTSLHARRTPVIEGRLARISPDVTLDAVSGAAFYHATAEISPEEMQRLSEYQLSAGMPVAAMISTGSQPPISYLVRPLRDYLSGAFRSQ